ncbi:Serine/threonine-protein kinase PrkC [Thalassoglobus neptunius]|uniref:Serine/threonine-protein kinase PrkC n=1 Tax=Thalassoglobus neptunius TaxID=1938619 RepID=A0A5C5X7D2_9PLAN|nr:protein kinase [Thalassoglobus neptunius]TWT58025.1 Serine/threonine-protein kinase PrkC [Thalassoglobus neptunius]
MNATTGTPLESLIVTLKRSGLIDASVLTQAVNDFRQQEGGSGPEDLTNVLIEKELITPWQAAKLLKGKHRGFFLGKYKLLTLLGKGGMSTVYLAEHVVMKRQVALKVLPHKLVQDSSYLERFHREAQAVAVLDHPNIVRAYDIDSEVDGQLEIHFLVMEFIPGHNFFELVRALGQLEPLTAADYIRQAALGLQHAHDAGLIHRDIKPGNFIVDGAGVVRMMDLGLAKAFRKDEDFSLTVANDEKVLGTADYLAPEQAVDSHNVDTRADIYALGCTFYFLLAGRPPFNEGTLAQRLLAHQSKTPKPVHRIKKDVPVELSDLIMRMMAKDPKKRVQTAQAVADELSAWLETNEEEPSGDSFAQLETPTVESLLRSNRGDGNDDAPEELVDFLSRLDSNVMTESPTGVSKSDSTIRRRGKEPDSTVHVTADSSKITRRSSSLVSSSKSSHRSRRTKSISQFWMWGGGFIVLVALWLMFSGDGAEPEPNSPPSPPVVEEDPAEESLEPLSPIAGSTITVGPSGNFRSVRTALLYVLEQDPSKARFQKIELAAGQTFEEHLAIDNSGLGQFPRGFEITGDESNRPVITGKNSSLLSLKSVEGLTVSNLVFDAANCPSAISISGYSTGTTFRNVAIRNIGQRGIQCFGVSGLAQQPVTCENCQFESDQQPVVAIQFTSESSIEASFSSTRHVQIRQCRFLGQFDSGIQLNEDLEDLIVERCIFQNAQTAIRFAGSERAIMGALICNNTFYRCARAIVIESSQVDRISEMSFVQNLFVENPDGEVTTRSPNVSLADIGKNGPPTRLNWSTGPSQTASEWLNIFEDGGRLNVDDLEFVSTDRESDNFLKPSKPDLRSPVKTPFRGAGFIGAVAPR